MWCQWRIKHPFGLRASELLQDRIVVDPIFELPQLPISPNEIRSTIAVEFARLSTSSDEVAYRHDTRASRQRVNYLDVYRPNGQTSG